MKEPLTERPVGSVTDTASGSLLYPVPAWLFLEFQKSCNRKWSAEEPNAFIADMKQSVLRTSLWKASFMFSKSYS